MQPKAWDVTRLAIIGAFAGVLYSFAQILIEPRSLDTARMVGMMIGGAVGGAFLFTVVALIRNKAAGVR